MPDKSDFIVRGNNTAIILLQNRDKHCIAWFLITVLINLKHRETYKLSFEKSGKQDFLGLKAFRIFQCEVQQILPIISDFWLLYQPLILQIIPQWLNVEKGNFRDIFRINYYYLLHQYKVFIFCKHEVFIF